MGLSPRKPGRDSLIRSHLTCPPDGVHSSVRTIKDAAKRRAAARELAKKCGVEIKTGYLAIGPYDLVIHAEAPNDEALATYLLSLASKGNVRTTTLKLFAEAEYDKIVGPSLKLAMSDRHKRGQQLGWPQGTQ